jgi:hypothetical protein
MRNNILNFADDYCLQKNGTAMGISTACAYATIYYSYQEELQLLQPHHHILFYRCLIDDALVIQTGEPGRFIQEMNSFGEPGQRLEWEATKAADTLDFLDFTILLHQGRIETRTYQKAMNLYLYPPPPRNPQASYTDSFMEQCTASTGRIPSQSGSPTA